MKNHERTCESCFEYFYDVDALPSYPTLCPTCGKAFKKQSEEYELYKRMTRK